MTNKIVLFIALAVGLASCKSDTTNTEVAESTSDSKAFEVKVDRFADIQVLRYQVPGFDKLSVKQKELVYYLSQAALSGRDIIYASNFKHNIQIRRTLEEVYQNYNGDKTTEDWKNFEIYLKRIWFSNGIHHHYSEKKIIPAFSDSYFDELVANSPDANWPTIEGEDGEAMIEKLKPFMFDDTMAPKKVVKDKGFDKIQASANNYYGDGITEDEAIAHYKSQMIEGNKQPIENGLNSRLVKVDGVLTDLTYKVGGLYSGALEKMVYWLEKANTVAENDEQAAHLKLLIEYFQTGDLNTWDRTNLAWINSTEGDIDFILGFIEVYGDAIGYKGAFEGVIEIKDFQASEQMQIMSQNAQWFEDNSPIMDEHKKANVVGVSYKVVNAVMESGDAAPATPIGVNLPNSNWIRANHGSKSVSLGNIVQAYSDASGSGSTEEFYLSKESQDRVKKHGKLAGKLHTAMHEVIGHASGQINEGIGTPKETLKNYSNTLEEARADLVALYYIYDQKLVDLGLMESLDVGKSEYDSYIMNGMMLQLRRLEPGDNVEEDHMRNRQLIASWCYEKGADENVIEKVVEGGKTYFVVNDYEKLRNLFGDLLREIQRLKSEGDFAAAEKLVEGYGIVADQDIMKEVKARYEQFNLAPYSGFVQSTLTPVMNGETFEDLKVTYTEGYVEQMLNLSKNYSFLGNDGN
ncbi:MAG: dihydrofolate reductase [Bacteroidetes bacterium]|jgi:dipeptidyl-peptidase-3|nr:dihydrofolate reductase [Bacteroidota bacterium]